MATRKYKEDIVRYRHLHDRISRVRGKKSEHARKDLRGKRIISGYNAALLGYTHRRQLIRVRAQLRAVISTLRPIRCFLMELANNALVQLSARVLKCV